MDYSDRSVRSGPDRSDFIAPDRLSDIGIPMMSDNLLYALKIWLNVVLIECALINTCHKEPNLLLVTPHE